MALCDRLDVYRMPEAIHHSKVGAGSVTGYYAENMCMLERTRQEGTA